VNAATPILRRLEEVDWGPRQDVQRLLAEVTVGEDADREDAWRRLWECIQHDGTIDDAVLPAVPVLIALADWHDYPRRVHAIVLLREVATADGVGPGHDHDHDQFADLREALAAGTRHLAARWRSEPPDIRRALVWLLSAVPEMRGRYHDLIDATLPGHLRPAWEAELVGTSSGDTLEDWVYGV
jgi:hypothetical protein